MSSKVNHKPRSPKANSSSIAGTASNRTRSNDTRIAAEVALEGTSICNIPAAAGGETGTTSVKSNDCLPSEIGEVQEYPLSSLIAFARLASNIVHEVNNPLGIVLSSCQNARRLLAPNSPPQIINSIDKAIGGVRRASEAVRNLIRFCCQEHSARQRFDIRDVMRFTALIVQSSESENPCTIDLQLDSEPSIVHGNPIELHIALASLVASAIQSGARQVRLGITPHTDTIELSIWSDVPDSTSSGGLRKQDSPSEMTSTEDDGQAQQDLVFTIIRDHGGELTHVRLPDATVRLCLKLPRYREKVA